MFHICLFRHQFIIYLQLFTVAEILTRGSQPLLSPLQRDYKIILNSNLSVNSRVQGFVCMCWIFLLDEVCFVSYLLESLPVHQPGSVPLEPLKCCFFSFKISFCLTANPWPDPFHTNCNCQDPQLTLASTWWPSDPETHLFKDTVAWQPFRSALKWQILPSSS